MKKILLKLCVFLFAYIIFVLSEDISLDYVKYAISDGKCVSNINFDNYQITVKLYLNESESCNFTYSNIKSPGLNTEETKPENSVTFRNEIGNIENSVTIRNEIGNIENSVTIRNEIGNIENSVTNRNEIGDIENSVTIRNEIGDMRLNKNTNSTPLATSGEIEEVSSSQSPINDDEEEEPYFTPESTYEKREREFINSLCSAKRKTSGLNITLQNNKFFDYNEIEMFLTKNYSDILTDSNQSEYKNSTIILWNDRKFFKVNNPDKAIFSYTVYDKTKFLDLVATYISLVEAQLGGQWMYLNDGLLIRFFKFQFANQPATMSIGCYYVVRDTFLNVQCLEVHYEFVKADITGEETIMFRFLKNVDGWFLDKKHILSAHLSPVGYVINERKIVRRADPRF